MKTLRLDLEALQVTTFEAGAVTVVAHMERRTPDSTCLFTQCPVTE